MTLAELVTITRRKLRDDVGMDADRYWSDSDLAGNLNEAQEEFAKQTLCLVESLDAAFCTIVLLANTHSYPINRRILRIDEVRASWRTNPLSDARSFRTFPAGWQVNHARPDSYCTDFSSFYLTLDKNPATVSGETLSLTVRRLPKTMTISQNAEIPDSFQRSLRFYATYLALDDKDSEIYKPELALRALARWNESIDAAKSAEANLQPEILVARSEF